MNEYGIYFNDEENDVQILTDLHVFIPYSERENMTFEMPSVCLSVRMCSLTTS
jgi:hypothetical protein